jgi:hypothetical protein
MEYLYKEDASRQPMEVMQTMVSYKIFRALASTRQHSSAQLMVHTKTLDSAHTSNTSVVNLGEPIC